MIFGFAADDVFVVVALPDGQAGGGTVEVDVLGGGHFEVAEDEGKGHFAAILSYCCRIGGRKIGECNDGMKMVGHDGEWTEEDIWVARWEGSPGLLNEGTVWRKGDLGVMNGAKERPALMGDEGDEVIGRGGVIEFREAELFTGGVVGGGHGFLGVILN